MGFANPWPCCLRRKAGGGFVDGGAVRGPVLSRPTRGARSLRHSTARRRRRRCHLCRKVGRLPLFSIQSNLSRSPTFELPVQLESSFLSKKGACHQETNRRGVSKAATCLHAGCRRHSAQPGTIPVRILGATKLDMVYELRLIAWSASSISFSNGIRNSGFKLRTANSDSLDARQEA